MALFNKKMEAHALRRQGHSVNKIALQLNVSKSAVSLWCRDIKLTKKQAEHLRLNSIAGGHRGRILGALVNKQKRIDNIEQHRHRGRARVGNLSERDLTILAASLFWAEGAKTGSRFMFVNSDPEMILCMYKYLTRVEKVEKRQFFITVQINRIHEPRINEVFRFWSNLLGLPQTQFGKPYYINVIPKKVYDNHESYYGIARLGVRAGSSLQYKLLGYIDALKSNNKLPA